MGVPAEPRHAQWNDGLPHHVMGGVPSETCPHLPLIRSPSCAEASYELLLFYFGASPPCSSLKGRRAQTDTLIQIHFLSFCLQLGLGTPGRLWGWAPRLGLGTPGSLLGWPGLGNSGRLWDWALQHSLGWALQVIGHSRESLKSGTPGSLWGWAVQGGSRSRPGEEKSSGRGEELSLKSNNPTPKVGNKHPKNTKTLPCKGNIGIVIVPFFCGGGGGGS